MFVVQEKQPRLCDCLSRREWLRIGGIGLGGLTLPALLRRRATAAAVGGKPIAKSVIVLFNGGGIPHHETFDPKPNAPQEIRGEFGVTQTKTSGLLIGELLPKTAQLTDRIAVIRSLVGAGFERVPAFSVSLTADQSQAVIDTAALKTPPGDYQIAFYGAAMARHKPQPPANGADAKNGRRAEGHR